MIVAFLQSRINDLNETARNGLNLSPVWVRYGEPAVWQSKADPTEGWLVYSDTRITLDDLALTATVLATPSLIKANYDTPARNETDRSAGAAQVQADARASVTDWDRGVIGTETVQVTVRERVIDHVDQVSIGMFCIASDPDTGDCIEWEERFKDVPAYVQEPSGQVDENGDPILVDKWVDVTYDEVRDVYVTPQEIMELQGPQVKNWVRAGDRVLEDLEPIEEL